MQTSASPAFESVSQQIQAQNVRAIDLQFTDVAGMVKTVTIDADRLTAVCRDGAWFDGSAVEGFARVAEADMYLRPDLNTFALVPWEAPHPDVGRTARLICDVITPNGEPFAGDPRWALRRAITEAEALGLRYVVAPELEFYLFQTPPLGAAPQPDDQASYFDAADGAARVIRKRAGDALRSMGFAVDSSHHEVGAGQHELDLAPMDALRAADALVTARMAIRTIAQQEGRFATFMPKPISSAPGNGLHIHQWLYDSATGANRFSDPANAYGLSAQAQAFLAGQLRYAREICAVLAPLVNSYKRLVAGQEAPLHITWAQLNRAALLRVPRLAELGHLGTQLEMRCPDPSCNPYLALTVLLHAGLRGLRDELSLPPAIEEELYAVPARRRHLPTLPISLREALEALEGSELAREALGLHLFERFIEAKDLEWQQYLPVVSQWELDRYLSLY